MPYCRFLERCRASTPLRSGINAGHRTEAIVCHITQWVITHKRRALPYCLLYNDAESGSISSRSKDILEDGHANFTKHVPTAKPQQACA